MSIFDKFKPKPTDESSNRRQRRAAAKGRRKGYGRPWYANDDARNRRIAEHAKIQKKRERAERRRQTEKAESLGIAHFPKI